jgi:hypothetical protein
MPAYIERISENVMPGNVRPAGGGGHEARQDPHCGAFAGSIWPQEPDDLSLFDLKAQAVYGNHSGVFFCKLFNFDHSIRSAKARRLLPSPPAQAGRRQAPKAACALRLSKFVVISVWVETKFV